MMGGTNRQQSTPSERNKRYASEKKQENNSNPDARIDKSGHFEFGGSWGTAALMIGFPLLMWYMWIGATYYDGQFPLPGQGQTWLEFTRHLGNIVYSKAFPTAKAWKIYWTFFLMEVAFYYLLPGVTGYGKRLEHEGGKQLRYYCSAYLSFYATIFIAAVLHMTGIFPLYTIIDEFGPIMSVAIVTGFLNSIIAYVSAIIRGRTHRMTGYPIYDFFMGAELNPRLGILDVKMFYEVRIPWFLLFLLTCATAARQYEMYGCVSGEVLFMIVAHFLYANALGKAEQMIITTWDMYWEKLGFMLTFWNLAGVPFTYCHGVLYLAHRNPTEYHWDKRALAVFMALYLFVYWIWDTANGQKNAFRQMERGQLQLRNTFPQLPWQVIQKPRALETGTGDRILVDGWFGLARKPHYVCDMFFAISWGLITGFKSPFPWFYPVFFCIMIAHRTMRDVTRCRQTHGEAWTQYEKMVPYLFIPYVV